MASNPFDDIHLRFNELAGKVNEIFDILKRPTPKWETVTHAMKTRRVGRKAIMDLITAGKIRVQQVPCPGGYSYNVSVEDLDLIFPVRAKHARAS